MSKMGAAALWVQENGLQNDPKALQKYIKHLNENGNNRNRIKKQAEIKNISGRKSL
jgi:hypothetical protein